MASTQKRDITVSDSLAFLTSTPKKDEKILASTLSNKGFTFD